MFGSICSLQYCVLISTHVASRLGPQGAIHVQSLGPNIALISLHDSLPSRDHVVHLLSYLTGVRLNADNIVDHAQVYCIILVQSSKPCRRYCKIRKQFSSANGCGAYIVPVVV